MGVRALKSEGRNPLSPKASLRRPAFTHTAETCKGVEQEEKTHPAQAASFLEFLSMKGLKGGIAPKAT